MNRKSVIGVVLLVGFFWLSGATGRCRAGGDGPRFDLTPEVARLIREGQESQYNCDFQTATRDFDTLVRMYPEHPAGYMYRAACLWWQCLLNTSDTSLQSRFQREAERGIACGETLVDKDPADFYARMFLAGVYGNQARFYVTITHRDFAAARAGLKGNRHNRSALALRPGCIDCLIGTGSFSYAPAALPPIVRPLAALIGVRLDVERGIGDLERAAREGEFTRTEAKILLLGIYFQEKRYGPYEELLDRLLEQYPANYIFYRWLANYCLAIRQPEKGDRLLATRLAGDFELPIPPLSRSYASLEQGRLQLARGDASAASSSFIAGIQGTEDRVFQARAHLCNGFALDRLGRREEAIREYTTVLALPDVDGSRASAARFLKSPYRSGGVEPRSEGLHF